MSRLVTPAIERFWKHIAIEPFTGCWIWMGGLYQSGYGAMSAGRAGGKMLRVHRFAYQYFRGEIPAELEPDHLCRIRPCANPWHLEAVTRRENFLRGNHPTAVAVRTDVCQRGHSLADAYVRKNGWRICRTCVRTYQRTRGVGAA